jgi:quinol monooxygenase YgiN
MSIRLVINSTVKDGMEQAWRDVAAKMTAASRDEEGTTGYLWHLGEDGKAINMDTFTDEAAMFAHVGAATEAGMVDAWMGTIDVSSFNVLDPVSDEAKQALAAFGASHYSQVEGF